MKKPDISMRHPSSAHSMVARQIIVEKSIYNATGQNIPSTNRSNVQIVSASSVEGKTVMDAVFHSVINRFVLNLESSDTLRRHLRQHHKINEPMNRARKACEACQMAKSRCEGDPPCEECVRRQTECTFKEDGPTLRKDHRQPLKDQLSTTIEHDAQSPRLLEKRDRCIELYFEKFHPHWSFIHRASFYAPREVPLMVQSMVVIGLWASGEPASQSAAQDLHNNLDAAIREQTVRYSSQYARWFNF